MNIFKLTNVSTAFFLLLGCGRCDFRIHTLFCGLVIIDTIAQYTQAEKIQVSMNGVREGYLIERVIGEQNA